MKPTLLASILMLAPAVLYSQVSIDNSQTIEHYVQNVLVGSGITVTNVTYNGGSAAVQHQSVGEFTDPALSVEIGNGVILATGNANLAQQNNNDGAQSLGGGNYFPQSTDPDLLGISSHDSIYDFCIVEFDFVPMGDTISFNYVFASEEYNEFVCSDYNDVFGFFLSGPNPAGGNYNAYNLARVPDPVTPGNFTNTMVAINTINNGTVGAFGMAANCNSIDANWASYNTFFVNNPANQYSYDGRTVALPAEAIVTCGETYHIKLAIGDAGDPWYDSGVFLEAGSFTSSPPLLATATSPGDIAMCTSTYSVDFDPGSNTPPHNYWDFGDGNNSTQASPTHIYADTGSYDVMYIAIDSTTCNIRDTAYLNVYITEAEVLTADINIPPVDPCQDSLQVDLAFTGTAADSIHWDLGDGNTSNDSALTHWYTQQNQYIITMEAFDFYCNVSATISDTVEFFPVYTSTNAQAPPNVELCTAPYDVDFTTNGTAPPYQYWDFGDASGNSNQANPTYTYADTGVYNVMYVAIDSTTCNIADNRLLHSPN